MDWLGKNYFKIGILVAIFLALYLIYSAFAEPQMHRQRNIASCNTQGATFSQQFQSRSKQENPNIISFVAPRYHYSESRNTCLSQNGYVFPDHGGTGTYMVITDVESGQSILQSANNIYGVNPSAGVVTYDDFMKQAASIMSN